MGLAHHYHKCLTCGNRTVYHIFDHESKGDTVTAFCDECDEDTDHEIEEYHSG